MESKNNKYFSLIFIHLFCMILVSVIGYSIGERYIPINLAWIFGIVALLILLGMTIKRAFDKNKKNVSEYGIQVPFWFVYMLSLFLGISLYPVIYTYVSSSGVETVFIAFGLTMFIFLSLSLYTYFSKRDFSFMGPFLFISLISLVVVSLVGIFIKNEILHLVLAYAGVVIFSGYIIYDISRIKFVNFTKKDIPGAVLNLYLNVINLFLDLLRIVDSFRR